MRIRAGYDITYQCSQPTPMLLALSVHPSRMADVIGPHQIRFDPPIDATEYRDAFGNICHRIVAPAGRLGISTQILVSDPGTPDVVRMRRNTPYRTCRMMPWFFFWAAATAKPND